VVTSVGITNKVFAVGGTGATFAAAKVKHGTTFTFRVSERSRVKVVIAGRSTGRRVNKRCVARTRKNAKKPRCTRFLRKGSNQAFRAAGRGSVRFNGRVKGKALAKGGYQATITATDAAGNVSRARTLNFTIV
jgi:hypothetical protein